jgi:hypothetical protein
VIGGDDPDSIALADTISGLAKFETTTSKLASRMAFTMLSPTATELISGCRS